MQQETPDELAKRRGNVLSSEDLKHEISERCLLFTMDEKDIPHKLNDWEKENGVQGDCYDFRVGYVISKRLGVVSSPDAFTLKPGEIVVLLSEEWVNLPNNIHAVVIPRNSQAKRGLLVLNAGHIDPNYIGQIMAQVVNLSARELSIRLDDFNTGVFSAVFSYLRTPSDKIPDPQESTKKRLSQIKADIGEQPETFVLAESEMRERFIPSDRFTQLLVKNIVAFVAGVGVFVGILTATGVISFENFPAKDWSPPLWMSVVIVLALVSFAYALIFPAIRYLLSKWGWWRKNMLM